MQEGKLPTQFVTTAIKQKRRVFLADEVKSVLVELNRMRSLSHKFIFIHKDGRPVRSIRTAFENACMRADIAGFAIHDLCHCFVTNMRKAGVHDSVIMAQTGYKTMSTFLRYNSVDESDGKEAVQKLSKYLGGNAKKSDAKVTHGAF